MVNREDCLLFYESKKLIKKQHVFYEGVKGQPFEEGKSYLESILKWESQQNRGANKIQESHLFNYTDYVKMIAEKCLLSKIDDSALIFFGITNRI